MRLTADEVYQLLTKTYQLAISPEEVTSLNAKTEGWITGILLGSSKVLRQRIHTGIGNQDHLFNYLATEIFQHLPARLQIFLMETSILEYLQADMCNALTESRDAIELLHECEQRRVFLNRVEVDLAGSEGATALTGTPLASDVNEYYRLHSLFRDFLRQHFKQTQPQRYLYLHQRAAQLAQQQGDFSRMLYHLLEAHDYPAAAQALLDHAEDELKANHFQTILDWLNMLPALLLKDRLDLKLVQIRALGLSGQFDQAYRLVDEVEADLQARPGDPLEPVRLIFLRGKLLRTESRLTAALEVQQRAQQALLKILPAGMKIMEVAEYSKIWAEIELELGICLGINGQYNRAIEALDQARLYYEQQDIRDRMAHVYQCLALSYNNLANSTTGWKYLERSLECWREVGSVSGQVDILTIMAGLHTAEARYKQALVLLDQALEQAKQIGYYSGCAYVLYYQANLYCNSGEFDRAVTCYREAGQWAERAQEKRLAIVLCSDMASVYRVLGDYKQAAVFLDRGMAALHRQEAESNVLWLMLKLGMAGLALDQNDNNTARMYLAEVEEGCVNFQYKPVLATKYLLQARLMFSQNRPKPALDNLTQSLLLIEDTSRSNLNMEALHAKALLQFAQARLSGQPAVHQILQKLIRALPGAENMLPEMATLSPAEPVPAPVIPKLVAAKPESVALIDFSRPLVAYAFGKTEVLVHGTPVRDWRSIKACELLFFLLDRGQPVRKEVILDTLWPDQDLAQVDNLFRTTLHRLRKATSPEWIKREGDSYGLSVSFSYDVANFKKLLQQGDHLDALSDSASQAQCQQAFEYYQAASELYRGDYLTNMYSDWCIERQEELSVLYIEGLLKQAELAIRLGLAEEVLTSLARCLTLDPCNEAAHLLRLRFYLRSKNTTMLSQSYQAYCQVLQQELKAKPSPEIQKFYQRAIQQLNP